MKKYLMVLGIVISGSAFAADANKGVRKPASQECEARLIRSGIVSAAEKSVVSENESEVIKNIRTQAGRDYYKKLRSDLQKQITDAATTACEQMESATAYINETSK